MDDCMSFPPTWQDFVAQYQFRDSEEVYTNGSKLIPVFRIEQMMEHYHERIEKENERLVIKLNAEHIARQNTEIENTKLRELCEDMNKVAHMLCEAWEGSCSKEAEGMSLHAVCPIGDTSELCVFGKLHDRMRELGIGDSND